MSAHVIEIVVRGRLSHGIVAALDGFAVEDAAVPGMTRITGTVVDQSMLFGILDMFDRLHIEVVSLNRVAGVDVSPGPDDARPPARP